MNYQLLVNNITKSLACGCRRLTTTQHRASSKVNLFDLNFDRRIKVDYKDSINYLNSEAYKKTYQGHLVWQLYRRNHKGQYKPLNTRPNCINKDGFLDSSYPCPICRDEYLVLHHENSKLLEQFINPYTGELMTSRESNLCQKQHRNLVVAILRAWDIGTLKKPTPNRIYDYGEYRESLN